jgi:hypothetical protein
MAALAMRLVLALAASLAAAQPAPQIVYSRNHAASSGPATAVVGPYQAGAPFPALYGREDVLSLGWNPSGYEFEYWSDSAAGGPYAPPAKMPEGGVSLYAIWAQVSQYSVSYDANGGTGRPPSDPRLYRASDEVSVLSSSSLKKAGFALAGFSLVKGGSPVTGFRIYANTELYAVWQPEIYKVSYDANGGRGEPPVDDAGYRYGDLAPVAAPDSSKLSRDGCRLAGFSLSKEGGPLQSISLEGDAILYAVWERLAYRVSYDANGGAGSLPSDLASYYYGSAATAMPAPGLSKKGYSLAGFSLEKGGAPVSSFAVMGNTTLYAVWGAEGTSRVLYHANGGAGPVPSDLSEYRKGELAAPMLSPKPTREGFSFLGWALGKSAALPVGAFTVEGPATLYAVWKEILYTVRFDAQGGKGDPPKAAAGLRKGERYAPPESPGLSKEGMRFAGWAESPEGKPEKSFAVSGSFTLYAVWEPELFAVRYDANGGSGDVPVDERLYLFGEEASVPAGAALEKEGFRLAGFSPIRGGAPVSLCRVEGDQTLYAVWAPSGFSVYKVEFDPKGGEGGAQRSATSEAPALGELMPGDPQRDGFDFLGWYILAPNGAKIPFDGRTPITGDTTVYAEWGGGELAFEPFGRAYSLVIAGAFACIFLFGILPIALSRGKRQKSPQRYRIAARTQPSSSKEGEARSVIEEWDEDPNL